MDELSALGVAYDVLAPDVHLRKLLHTSRASRASRASPPPCPQPPSPPPNSHQYAHPSSSSPAASQPQPPPQAGSSPPVSRPEAAAREDSTTALGDEYAVTLDGLEDGQLKLSGQVRVLAGVARSALGMVDEVVRAAAARADVGKYSAPLERARKTHRDLRQPRTKAGILVGCLCALRFGLLRAAIGALALLLAWDLSLSAMHYVRRKACRKQVGSRGTM